MHGLVRVLLIIRLNRGILALRELAWMLSRQKEQSEDINMATKWVAACQRYFVQQNTGDLVKMNVEDTTKHC